MQKYKSERNKKKALDKLKIGRINKKKRIRGYCKHCEKPITKKGNIYCNLNCFIQFWKNTRYEKFNSGKMSDTQARLFFRNTRERTCSICNLSEWMGKEIPLEVDHIDGNYLNNFPNNLRFVCCNCGAQLDTYKAKNKGNGRKNRRI